MKILLIFVVVGLAIAEKPGPYPHQGWKPQGARLELPSRQYGVPRDPNQVDITTPRNEYVPPASSRNNDDDFLQVQALPAVNSFSQFNKLQQQQPQQQQRANSRPQKILSNGQQFLLAPAFAPQFASQNGQFREQNFPNPRNNVQQLSFNGNAAQNPSRQYGAPFTTTEVPELTTQQPEIFPPQNVPSESDEEEDYDDQRPVIAIANAEAHGNANLVAATQQGQFGQYYILLPDASLQKVRFATGQTDDDRTINGFSAQLKYSPVEAIKDPVFGYDQQGKIVRLYK